MKPDSPLHHTKHIFRVGLLLLLALIVLVLGRSLFVPDTWGQFGWYRGASVEEYRGLPARHGGDASCESCHDSEFADHAASGHSVVNCELCHAPLSAHIADDDKIADMPVLESNELCLRCHHLLRARPADFPQVQPRQHVIEQGGEYSPDACFDCHEPHSPL